MIITRIDSIYKRFFSEARKKQFERLIYLVAITAFILHFSLIILANVGLLPDSFHLSMGKIDLLTSLYTPFSIILLYEVYLLMYYLPKSITIYLGKQYEVITLIMIRKVFDDLGNLVPNMSVLCWEDSKGLLFSLVGLLVLFFLLFLFYKISGNKGVREPCKTRSQQLFVTSKKMLALGLLVLFVVLFVKSFFDLRGLELNIDNGVYALKRINDIFFSTFFTALILTEVLLLLLTFDLTEKFSKVIRNAGFIISTILLKLSFMVEGVANILIVIVAVLFGILILWIYRLYQTRL